MRIFELVTPALLFIFLAFMFFTHTPKGRFILFVCAALWVGFHLYSEYKYKLDPIEYIAEEASYCGTDIPCWWSGKYEAQRLAEIRTSPSVEICRACPARRILVDRPVTQYVRISQAELGRRDIERLLQYIGRPLAEVEEDIAGRTGIRFTSYDSQTVTTARGSQMTLYDLKLGHDELLPELVNMQNGCVYGSRLAVGVVDNYVQAVHWIGKVDKNCFDLTWLPAVARWRNYRIDEQFRSRRQIATAIRYYDERHARIIVVSSRSPLREHQRVGLRIGVEGSQHTPLVERYDEWPFLAFYRATEDIAQE